MHINKKPKLETSFTELRFKLLKRIISYWNGYVDVLQSSDWKKLYGKKNGQIIQFFTRVSYLYFQDQYESTVPVNPFFHPFKFEQFIKITAICTKTHFSEERIWLHEWNNLTDICILNVNSPQQKKPNVASKGHAKRTIEALESLEKLRSMTLNTCELYGLSRHIHKLQHLRSLTMRFFDLKLLHCTPLNWTELFNHIADLDNLTYLDIMFIPPDGHFHLLSLRHLHLRYYKKARDFKISAPKLRSISFTQLHTDNFDNDVETIVRSVQSDSLQSVEINFNKMRDISSILSIDVLPTTVTSCRLGYQGKQHMIWFAHGQAQFRTIEFNVSRKVAATTLKQFKYQQSLQVLSFKELDINNDTFNFVVHLPHLHLITVESGSVNSLKVPRGVTVNFGSKVIKRVK